LSRRSSSTTPPRAGSSLTTPPCAGSSSTNPPRAGSSSTTPPTPCVRVPWHVARLITCHRDRMLRHVARLVAWLVAPLVVDYAASRGLVVDYFASATRPGASARRAARHAARRAARLRLLCLAQARRRLLRLRRASRCLGTSSGSSRGSSRRSLSTTPPHNGSSSTTSPPSRVRVPRHVARLVTPLVVDYSALRRLVVDYSASRRLVVDYFAHAARLGASALRSACHVARRAARRRLLHLRRMSGSLGSSRGSSRRSSSTTQPRAGSTSTTPPRAGSLLTTPPRAGSSSTTSPTPRVRVPRHVARLITCR
jgi:hypothetical protein